MILHHKDICDVQVYERKRAAQPPPLEEQAAEPEPEPIEDAASPSEEQAPAAEAPPPAKKRGRYASLWGLGVRDY